MVKRCSICNHPSRPEIDRGLLTGAPYRALAGQFLRLMGKYNITLGDAA